MVFLLHIYSFICYNANIYVIYTFGTEVILRLLIDFDS